MLKINEKYAMIAKNSDSLYFISNFFVWKIIDSHESQKYSYLLIKTRIIRIKYKIYYLWDNYVWLRVRLQNMMKIFIIKNKVNQKP